MSEKRDKKRHPKRFTLRFGPEEAVRIGFTEDISREGLFIKTTNGLPPYNRVIIDLSVGDGVVKIEGQVRWMKKVPPNLIHFVKKGGFGVKIIRFISGEDIYHNIFEDKHSVHTNIS